MNIFVLDEDPILAAQYHCDKHVCKMMIESAQIICTVLSNRGVDVPYKPTHIHHPCVLWAAADAANMYWLWQHHQALCAEYTRRYKRMHLTEQKMQNVQIQPAQWADHSPFVLCMPVQYKSADAICSYRRYYKHEKTFAKWAFTGAPVWWSTAL